MALNLMRLIPLTVFTRKCETCFTPLLSEIQDIRYGRFQALSKKMSSAELITNIDKNELKKFMDDPTATVVDVREVKEIEETGKLPGSINIPLGTLSDALGASEETFKKMYNKTKPALDNPIVFSCRSGRRSFLASETAVSLGYKKKTATNINMTVPSQTKSQQLETLFLSDNNKPLTGWTKFVKNGYIKRINDEDILGKVIELSGNPDTVYIGTPEKPGESLGIQKRWFSLLIKPLHQDAMKFQVQCLDSTGVKRVFRFDTRCTSPRVQYHFADIPFSYKTGWNNLDVDLKMLMRKAYCTDLSQVVRVHVHAACRLKRIFFSDVFIGDESLPNDYKLISAYKEFKPRSLKEIATK